ncbi:hypothetical protein C8J27_11519 [Rhodobacter aestuarii]|uniref:Uncharacterized protein n=1 Tax=Rhodobacter aestuarii TaxID=453582 RepID=A0A1N7QF07_9RHOB|nr:MULTISPECIES: hypothetical protein [Rhodobacter]PTV93506.1 hypothetical protein C8J27_11519 [Rhodobacter aestuarii]SIT21443.1 hypothetical protein SAMN05421580_11722 [Rhodobacter aestuarii]SOC08493.1 hypothetical protein SAMN05877809_104313 [Rhodobacter sp. JA431]
MNAMTRNETWQRIGDLADRVRRLCPDHRNPERFHIEKSEIEHELRRLASVAGPSGEAAIRVIRTPTHG